MIKWLGFGGCFVLAAIHQKPPALLGPARGPEQQKSLRTRLDTSGLDFGNTKTITDEMLHF